MCVSIYIYIGACLEISSQESTLDSCSFPCVAWSTRPHLVCMHGGTLLSSPQQQLTFG